MVNKHVRLACLLAIFMVSPFLSLCQFIKPLGLRFMRIPNSNSWAVSAIALFRNSVEIWECELITLFWKSLVGYW